MRVTFASIGIIANKIPPTGGLPAQPATRPTPLKPGVAPLDRAGATSILFQKGFGCGPVSPQDARGYAAPGRENQSECV